MSPHMFYSHYGLNTNPPATHLCYEVYRQADLIASGHLTNTNEEHAEEVFIGERFQEAWRNCTIFWYISWSPCDHCMEILLNTFLPRNPLVTLHIIFAKKYKLSSKSNIRKLSYRGVQIHVMTFPGKYYLKKTVFSKMMQSSYYHFTFKGNILPCRYLVCYQL